VGLSADVEVFGAGSLVTCAVAGTGELRCWGRNLFGELGDGTFADRSSPVVVCGNESCSAPLTGVTAVDSGQTHTCAVVDGRAWCWGNDRRGQLGREECSASCPRPGPVAGLSSGVRDVAMGKDHSCALLEDGTMRCWGDNEDGQLGDGTLVRRNTPAVVCADEACAAPLSGVLAIDAGGDHTCALLEGGLLRCWGINGHASITSGRICSPDCTTPAEVCLAYTDAPDPPGCAEPLDGVTAIAVGNDHQCIARAGRALCWGDHNKGQLGVGFRCTTIICTTPIEVCADETCAASLDGVTAISSGWAHVCAIASGAVKCWGNNDLHQLGLGVDPNEPLCECRITPADVVGLPVARKTPPVPTATRTATPIASSTSQPPLSPTATATSALPACGDVNGNGAVDSIDVALMLQHIAGLLPVLPNALSSDLNGDGLLTAVDAALGLQHIAGLLPRLRCPAHP
jgi:alpha-tubulin suppressor-like RCC1 family protein